MDNIRQRQILSYLKAKRSCTLDELMAHFKVSSATIHRDAAALSRRDAIERVRGGLLYRDAPDPAAGAADYQGRVVTHRAQKIAASRKALALIEEGDILFLDSSTTVYELALLLMKCKFDHLTVITNSIAVMHLFRKFPPHWSMISLGGSYDPQLNAILGASAIEQISRFNITKAFISAFGLDDKATTTNHERQAEMLKSILDAADRRFLIIDRSKLHRKGLYRIASRSKFDAILTDR